jgi:ketosteroid isomerase-like protein
MIKLLMALLPAAVLASAAPAVAQVDLGTARALLRAADRSVSDEVQARGVRIGLAPHLADSADVLIPGAVLLRGRDAALAELDRGPFAGTRLRWEPIRVDVSADGRSGYTYGGGTSTGADGTSTPARYIAFWRRDGDGWKIAAFQFNPHPRPLAPPPAGFFREDDARAATPSGADATAALQQIMQADRDFSALSVAQGPGAAFRAYAAPDGALGGAYGPEAIGAVFGEGGGSLQWMPTAGGTAASGDLGYTVGTGVARGPQGQAGYSKYITVWRREPNGEWRWVVDGGNPRPADP